MESLGKHLRDLRQQRNLSYEQIWQDIRLSEAHVRALEENRLFDIGHYGYVKVMVFNYARYLEANVDQVMAEFRIMMPETTKKEFTPRRTLKEKKIMLSTNFLWTVGIVIFVGILGSILLNAYRQGWLQTPELFERKESVSAAEAKPSDETDKPDSLRLRMRALSESIPRSNTLQDLDDSIPRDTTDYIGNILGSSPLNVQIN
ncbi:MAG: helix-turn-helix domain-containing protein [Candidatus Cloacimonadaceae bacterium]|jgi:cytoskeletal protein RodZ|nr:helix-turn-helix domain-containing protein [Candidatus Cloacimonadaceae bacterium]